MSTRGQGIFLNLTHGERGNTAITPPEYGAVRVPATDKAAGILRAENAYPSYHDGELLDNDEVCFAVCDAVQLHKPEIIVMHRKVSYHKDHSACHNIVGDTISYAGLPSFERELPAHSVSKLSFAENWEEAEGFLPDIYLDASDGFGHWT